MADRVDIETRKKIMRANRSKNTGPEMIVRKAFFSMGFRYRICDRKLPGKPDIVFPKYNAVVFIHGCFWHGHKCHREPHARSNKKYWHDKIIANKNRDLLERNKLFQDKWRILIIWECAIRRRNPNFTESTEFKNAKKWLRGNGKLAIISENGYEECL
jgi:DNA mismatch endonuclease (patch repair protein)